ncbi:extracellular solute-binding protein [Paenibacillus sp. DMB20]|uniref:extracellular solute-binding protein n=1 Tax=Paenibacillus sp. DMB20 TaxID=1642570 RepID=UPI000AF86D9A|nr:extracellular solute-binding protein [Paenibacillus sp. DMB20]
MKTNKKLSAKSILLLTMCLVMLMVTACSGKEASSGNEKDENGGYKDKLKISVASTIQVKDGQMENEFHKYWMDKYNIEWDYNFVEWDSWAEKLRLWINSGDLPDVATWNYIHGDA